MSKIKHEDLVSSYRENESCDKPLFAEQRSNILLASGNHYTRSNSRFFSRLRDDKSVSNEVKVRLTKNHTQRICKIYENSILTYAPDVAVQANNESELQDQKAAELNHSVKQYIHKKHKIKNKTRQFAQDYVRVGECVVEAFWDPSKGELKGYEQALDESGAPLMDETGQPVKDESRPVMTGDLVIKRHLGMNLLRPREARTMEDAPYLEVREMVDVSELKKMVAGDAAKEKLIEETRDETFVVFDGSSNEYKEAKNQCLLLRRYYRKCLTYPKGYYVYYTLKGILFEDELPFGIFPIRYAGFDEVQTQPRHHSIIKVTRPYQAEINRTGSKIAEHQMTLGDDKLLIQNGTKITNGGLLPGVRAVQYSGAPPGILQGRSGEHYLNYMQSQIAEMYQAANIPDEVAEKPQTNDPYTQLFESMKQKKKFVVYADKFGDFLVEMWEMILEIAKNYLDEDMLIPMIGRTEFVNISEFKNSDPLCYRVSVEQSTEDIESRMGKQLTINQILQYVGTNLSKEDIGMIIRNSPYLNKEEMSEGLTLDYDTATNDILSMDRGQYRPAQLYQNHEYMIKRLSTRMSKSDFQFLSPQIQDMYAQKIKEHEQVKVEEINRLKQAQSELIPTGGYMVSCDFYMQKDPNNPNKVERVRIPSEALQFLIDRLQAQGATLQSLEQMNQGAMAQMAQQLLTQGQPSPPQMGAGGLPMMG